MMTSDLKITQKIEQERLALLEQLLKERFGETTREGAASIELNK
jgi:hypothetical protein